MLNQFRPQKPTKASELISQLSILSAIAGVGISFASQQILHAILPISLSLALSETNRRKQEQVLTLMIQQQASALVTIAEKEELRQQDLEMKVKNLQEQNIALSPAQKREISQRLRPLINQLDKVQRRQKEIQLRHEPQLQQQINDLENHLGILDTMVKSLPTQASSHSHGSKYYTLQAQHQQAKVKVFIDAANINCSARELERQVDPEKLFKFVIQQFQPVQVFYYVGLRAEQSGRRARLQAIGYEVISKPGIPQDDGRLKANLDVEMSWDIAEQVEPNDTLILVTGDGDLAYAVEQVKRRGVTVKVMGFRNNTSQALIIAADQYIDLESLTDEFCKPKYISDRWKTA